MKSFLFEPQVSTVTIVCPSLDAPAETKMDGSSPSMSGL